MITEQTAMRAVGVGGVDALLRCSIACLDVSLGNDVGALGNTAEGQGGCAQYPAKAGVRRNVVTRGAGNAGVLARRLRKTVRRPLV